MNSIEQSNLWKIKRYQYAMPSCLRIICKATSERDFASHGTQNRAKVSHLIGQSQPGIYKIYASVYRSI